MKGKKIEIDEAMTQKMSYTRSEKEAHEAISYIQEEITQKERELRRLTSKVILHFTNLGTFKLKLKQRLKCRPTRNIDPLFWKI